MSSTSTEGQKLHEILAPVLVIISGKSLVFLGKLLPVPSDTKLLLTKNYSEIIIFEKLRISYVIPWKSASFPEILKVRTPSKITKNNSQGIIFVISPSRLKRG